MAEAASRPLPWSVLLRGLLATRVRCSRCRGVSVRPSRHAIRDRRCRALRLALWRCQGCDTHFVLPRRFKESDVPRGASSPLPPCPRCGSTYVSSSSRSTVAQRAIGVELYSCLACHRRYRSWRPWDLAANVVAALLLMGALAGIVASARYGMEAIKKQAPRKTKRSDGGRYAPPPIAPMVAASETARA